MYQGPLKIIRKRYDKLLDYDNAAARQRNAGDSEQAKAVLCISNFKTSSKSHHYYNVSV